MEEDIDAFLAQLGTIAPASSEQPSNDTKIRSQTQISSTQNRTDHVINTDISVNNSTLDTPKRSVLLPRAGALAPNGLRPIGLRPVGLRPVPMGLRPVVSSTLTSASHTSLTPVSASNSLYTVNSGIVDDEEEAELLVSIDGTISSLSPPSSSSLESSASTPSSTVSTSAKNFIHPSRMAQVPTQGITSASNASNTFSGNDTVSQTSTALTTTQVSSTNIHSEKRRHSAMSISETSPNDEEDKGIEKTERDNMSIAPRVPSSSIPTQGPLPTYDEQAAIIQANAIANSIALSRSAYTQSSMTLPATPATLSTNEVIDPKSKKHLRCAAGKIWNDPTLEEWPENDFRIFVGNLGNDVSDEILSKFFSHYSSFTKARVVRDRTGKPKGYGFASLLQPLEMARALREMEGKYCGSRPVTLKRAQTEKREFHLQSDFKRCKKNHSY